MCVFLSPIGVHDASSRSHAILKVFFASPTQLKLGRQQQGADASVSSSFGGGVLTLIDLAGEAIVVRRERKWAGAM